MAKEISEEDIQDAIAQISHPAVDRTLVDQGIVKKISIKDNKSRLLWRFPSPIFPLGIIL